MSAPQRYPYPSAPAPEVSESPASLSSPADVTSAPRNLALTPTPPLEFSTSIPSLGAPSTSSLSGISQHHDPPPQHSSSKPSTSPPAEVHEESELGPVPVGDTDLHTSGSTAEPVQAMAPMDVTPKDVSAISVASFPAPEQESLKRASSAVSTADEGQQHKKQRLEGQEQPGDVAQHPTGMDQDVTHVHRNDDEESEDGDIEIGPDGLRTVEDCISALMDDDEENDELQTCQLCVVRFKRGYMNEPKPFLRATTDELVQHFTSEHSDAWETIRRSV
ncbi:hypothetical protein FPV67DRAFT_1664741 [Lyophyllum atratum]|nr:hypothetical protein FPV67DRAFT_1664741 [Lyophyllum atratum]